MLYNCILMEISVNYTQSHSIMTLWLIVQLTDETH